MPQEDITTLSELTPDGLIAAVKELQPVRLSRLVEHLQRDEPHLNEATVLGALRALKEGKVRRGPYRLWVLGGWKWKPTHAPGRPCKRRRDSEAALLRNTTCRKCLLALGYLKSLPEVDHPPDFQPPSWAIQAKVAHSVALPAPRVGSRKRRKTTLGASDDSRGTYANFIGHRRKSEDRYEESDGFYAPPLA